MSWTVQSHIIPAAYARGAPHGVRPSGRLRLAVKQYSRTDSASLDASALTLIVAHGIGASKESFEPFFDELLRQDVAPIREIWIADAVHNGESYLLNKSAIGHEIDWTDYSRDIYQMICVFQEQIKQPLVGVGLSLGAGVIAYLASWHPRLFCGVALIEPAMGAGPEGTPWPVKADPGLAALKRQDVWASKDEATAALRRMRKYRTYDERAFDKVVEHELQETSAAGLTGRANSVTLVTPKQMEVSMWLTPDPPLSEHQRRAELAYPAEETTVAPGMRRPDGWKMRKALPELLIPVFYIWGTKSPFSTEIRRKRYLQHTARYLENRDKHVTSISVNTGHMAPHEDPKETARVLGEWLSEIHRRETTPLSQPQVGLEPGKTLHPAYAERYSEKWISKL